MRKHNGAEPSGDTGASGLKRVLISTAVAGAAGFIIQVGAGVLLGPGTEYLAFSVFWAALYLSIGALSGIQQEVARSSARGTAGGGGESGQVWRFIAITSVIVVAIIGATSFFWGPAVFGEESASSVAFLAAGALGYVALAALSGVLYGTGQWNTLAWSIVADPVLRCVLLGVALGLMLSAQTVQLAVVLPLFLTAAFVGAVWWKSKTSVLLDVRVPELLWNVARAVVGSAATAVLVSGFPLFLKVGLSGSSPELVATIIFVVNFTRAPIVIPLLALQSYMVVSFARDAKNLWKRLVAICGIGIGVSAGIGLAAYFLSPWVFGVLLGGTYAPNPVFVGSIIAASGLTAALCVTGSAALSHSLHSIFSLGWAVAAITTVGLLFVPLSAEPRVVVALALGPLIGLLVHGIGLARALFSSGRGAAH